jgi:hypothetical protein
MKAFFRNVILTAAGAGFFALGYATAKGLRIVDEHRSALLAIEALESNAGLYADRASLEDVEEILSTYGELIAATIERQSEFEDSVGEFLEAVINGGQGWQ